MTQESYAWLDATPEPDVRVAMAPNADRMRQGALDGKDRVWWCDGKHVWFRRSKSNPATLQRHNRFVADGDYQYIATHDDVECYQLREQSIFAIKKTKTVDLSTFSDYEVKRLAAKAALKHDWQVFSDVVTYIRDRLNQNVRDGGWTQQWANIKFGDSYADLVEMVLRRNGPGPGEINAALARLQRNSGSATGRIITVG
jgi:hypothetical protein